MLALIYLIVMVLLGDSICRRFYAFVWLPHRFAAAFLSGLLISSWVTYLTALLFAQTSQPLLWGNFLFLITAAGSIFWLRKHPPIEKSHQSIPLQAIKSNKWDWIVIVFFFVFAYLLMFNTFGFSAGNVKIANIIGDFGATLPIAQSFALGHNFPTEYPHFTGERIRYHFLFFFQVGNLEYLGFNPALSNNILSILSLVSMLILVMTLGVVLFRSHLVGRIAAVLFFFHGSLSYIPFILSQESISKMLTTLWTMRSFLPSGFPYRGEDWGVWSQLVFLNQRHLTSSIGIFLLVLVFIIIRYRAALSLDNDLEGAVEHDQTFGETAGGVAESKTLPNIISFTRKIKSTVPFIFSGALLGLLPMWNSAIFMAAFAVLALLFLLFPLKKQMLALALTTAIFSLPQVIFLKTDSMSSAGYSLYHWGYTLNNPSFPTVLQYLGFTFGFKWLLIAVALFFATKLQRRMMIAISSLLAIPFFFQFSKEVLANHKFFNVWLIIANLFVAYGLCQLWKSKLLKTAMLGKIAAIILVASIAIGGVIDLFPIRNSYWVDMPFEDDALVHWVNEKTDPKAIFLSSTFDKHGILLAGRRVFYGHSYYIWSAGYPTAEREVIYKRMFEEKNPTQLLRLLQENKISYVAIDNEVRKNFIKNSNEEVFKVNFEEVFQDSKNQYNALVIYKVPTNLPNVPISLPNKLP